jgi:transposase-like protein
MKRKPKILQEAIVYFADPGNCLDFIVGLRWPKGVECPTCGSKEIRFISSPPMWECKSQHPRKQFSIKVGTVFEDSPIGLDKWLTALWMIANCKNGVSSYEIARTIGVTQKSAWFMLHRIRLAMQSRSFLKLGKAGGEVEVDETFIGGKARNMHLDKRERRITGTGEKDKTAVLGFLERGGKVRTMVIGSRRKKPLQTEVRKHVAAGAPLYTDALQSYGGLAQDYRHKIIDHARGYVQGRVHTNGLENFWSIFKRGIRGTYVSVEPFHLFRYLDEQAFRYNNREKPMNDANRFTKLLSHVVVKRLTYSDLTRKTATTHS